VFPSSSQGVSIKFPKCPILFGHGSTSIYISLEKGEGIVWLWIKGKHNKAREALESKGSIFRELIILHNIVVKHML
jgi:hypothetical protein